MSMPTNNDSILKFTNYRYQFRLPIVAYVDFECILKPIRTCFPNPTPSFIGNNELHMPMSFCVYFIIDDTINGIIKNRLPSEPFLYRSKHAEQNL